MNHLVDGVERKIEEKEKTHRRDFKDHIVSVFRGVLMDETYGFALCRQPVSIALATLLVLGS